MQCQAVLALANVPGDDAAAAIRNADPGGPVGMVRSVALARHGDAAAVASLAALMPNLNGYLKIQAGWALAENLNPKGIEILEEMRQSPIDLDRVMAAEALGRINPDAAYRTLIASLNGGSAAVKPAALHAAGVVRMGTDPAVYQLLTHADDDSRRGDRSGCGNARAILPLRRRAADCDAADPARQPARHPAAVFTLATALGSR